MTTPYGYPVQTPTAQTPIPPSGVTLPSVTPYAAAPQQTITPGYPRLPLEESYIENILRLNLGKVATIYMTFENNEEWNAKVFRGVLEAAGRDHIIISDPKTGRRYLLLMVNLDYITFDEELNYFYPAPLPYMPRGSSHD
ncbi:MAG: spore coat protein GerQ [Bacillaceae bacterium]|nr:spore coat protein GerQ [Bacillaceae bacterium]